MDTNDVNLSLDSIDLDSVEGPFTETESEEWTRKGSRALDAEHMFRALANLGDGELKGYRTVRAPELRRMLGWGKGTRDYSQDDRITDAANLLRMNGLVILDVESSPPIVQLSMKGRAEARRRGVELAGAPVEDARWLLEQLVGRDLETPGEVQLLKITRWPWPRITDALTILDQLDLVGFAGDDDSLDTDDCERGEVIVWTDGAHAVRDGYGWEGLIRPWEATGESQRGASSSDLVLGDHRMWPSRAIR